MIQITERQALQARVDQCRRLSVDNNDPTTSAGLLVFQKEVEQQRYQFGKPSAQRLY